MIGTLIEVPAWGTMTLIEAVWLASGLLALIVTGRHLFPLYDDWRVAKSTGRPVLEKVAWAYVRREIIRMAQGLCLVTVGAYAALQEQAIPGPAVVTITGLVLTVILLILALLISLQSVMDWRTRGEVQDLLSAGTNGHLTDVEIAEEDFVGHSSPALPPPCEEVSL